MSDHVSKIESFRGKNVRVRSVLILAAALGLLIYFGFRRMRAFMMLGYMDSAIGRMRALCAVEAQFAKEHPEVGFTCALTELPATSEMQRLLSNGGIDNGYAFEVSGCQSRSSDKPNSAYHITARPFHSGMPAYCSDQSTILKYDEPGSLERCLANGTPF